MALRWTGTGPGAACGLQVPATASVRSAGASDGDDGEGPAFDGDRARFLQRFGIDEADERMAWIGDGDLAVGHRQPRTLLCGCAGGLPAAVGFPSELIEAELNG